MTASVNDVGLLVVVCFSDVTKPASICNHEVLKSRSLDVRTQSVVNMIIH